MIPPARPRRSVLYMPGSNARALEKGKTLLADGLIFDLEDATAPDQKEQAREQVVAAVKAGGYGRREIFIRVNGLDTEWGHSDLVAAARSGADAVLLPKVESADEVRQAVRILVSAGAPSELPVWCMMETPRAILRAEEIADSTSRLAGFVMGTSDLTKDLHAAHTTMRLPMIVSLGTSLLAARAAGIAILDGVHLDLEDEEGFRRACTQGKELGFDGKTLIHPKQVDAANEVFAPSEAEVTAAHRAIAVWEEAQHAGKAVVVVDGKLVEHLHVAEARRIVALADAIGAS